MYQKERIESIMNILKENGYVTVKFLTDNLHYSTATINRDLNLMEKQKLVTRSYGGVELVKRKGVPLPFRYHKMKVVKNRMGKLAADLVDDGDTIFVDGSTTTEYMARHLDTKKGITVITNNIAIVSYLSEYNINIICLGGKIVEPPSMLSGNDCIEMASKYNADKMFFSTGAISDAGIIGESEMYYLLHKTMAHNSKRVYYMADHEKINVNVSLNAFTLDDVDGVVTDYVFSDEAKKRYKNTKFYEAK
ncbi:MAG: DeoR/GlpR transcriptional regulator [Clostridia bacterium]|nr:DeoR/GlpR transcriptional regulator [Clostridia bacterium]